MTTAAQYYEQAKIEEHAAKLTSDGYKITRQALVAGMHFDLIAEKGDEKIFFEFIFRKGSKSKREQIANLQKVANKHGATEFRAIIFDVPKQIDVEIEWIDEVLNDLMQTQEAEDEVVNIGNGCSFDGVYSGAITALKMDADGIRIAGSGQVDVEIHMGPSNDGTSVSDNFPFIYDITVDYEKQLQEVHLIAIDDSGFYENSDEAEEDDEDDEDEPNEDPELGNPPY